jgi:hypothetical protein
MKAVKIPDPGGGIEYTVILFFNSTLMGAFHSGLLNNATI